MGLVMSCLDASLILLLTMATKFKMVETNVFDDSAVPVQSNCWLRITSINESERECAINNSLGVVNRSS